jgi:hypothetical protein
VDEAKSHQSVNWYAYFKSIREQCPWSYAAYMRNEIQFLPWNPGIEPHPLDQYQARMWLMDYPNSIIEAMAEELNSRDLENEWLFSYPGYGEYATPVPVLIQQDRKTLTDLRSKLQD